MHILPDNYHLAGFKLSPWRLSYRFIHHGCSFFLPSWHPQAVQTFASSSSASSISYHLVQILLLLCYDCSVPSSAQKMTFCRLWSIELKCAVIKLELLAVEWAIIKCKLFLRGLQNFQIITDHSPLVPILNSYRLDEIDNIWLQSLQAKLMAYNFTAIWCKESSNTAPDVLSQHPILEPTQEDAIAERDENSTPAPSISELRVCQSGSSTENVWLRDLR